MKVFNPYPEELLKHTCSAEISKDVLNTRITSSMSGKTQYKMLVCVVCGRDLGIISGNISDNRFLSMVKRKDRKITGGIRKKY